MVYFFLTTYERRRIRKSVYKCFIKCEPNVTGQRAGAAFKKRSEASAAAGDKLHRG